MIDYCKVPQKDLGTYFSKTWVQHDPATVYQETHSHGSNSHSAKAPGSGSMFPVTGIESSLCVVQLP